MIAAVVDNVLDLLLDYCNVLVLDYCNSESLLVLLFIVVLAVCIEVFSAPRVQ